VIADEPPYFLPQNSSSTSNNDVGISRMPDRQFIPGMRQSNTHGSSADDFRSVIDDLTIENKKLRDRLRRYERLQAPQLEKDKMFELKIYGLPSRKRRELEDVLREFASSIDGSQDEDTKLSLREQRLAYASLNPHRSTSSSNPKHTPSSSTSNSRPVDSAYASMSTSGPTSTSTLNRITGPEKVTGVQPRAAKEHKIHSFLHNIPESVLPQHSPVMTERQKKKHVVQRLEQLFTGRRGAMAGANSQPLQQQEVSKSAAKADLAAREGPLEEEGSREAHILSMDVDVDNRKPSKLLGGASDATSSSRSVSDSSDEQSPERSIPKQRPTRPMDLDPDRAQIPSENVEYIRHLGLSTPQLITENSADVAADAEGWIYLNLLINMAQLHIINVTPEFVRSALSDVSEKFQISRDGKKVRWRGGSEGTHLSSDSGESSVRNRFLQDSDPEDGSRKRRKVAVGRFASAPVEVDNSPGREEQSALSNMFHYKPLFHHHNSSSGGMMSTDESDSPSGSGTELDSISRKQSKGAYAWSGVSQSIGSKRRRRDDGPIVFYNGARFCIDLSGDRGNIITPVHVFGISKDGYSNQAEAALGSTNKSAPAFTRTTSGSLLPYRPFKDYSKGSDPFQTEDNRPKTPELFNDMSEDEQFVYDLPKESAPYVQLQDFEASGLGGIQPTDHFTVQVQTRRRHSFGAEGTKLSRFSRFSSPIKSPRKFLHSIPKNSIALFRDKSPDASIADRLAAWSGFSSPPRATSVSHDKLPVKTEILSTKLVPLEPSQLPPPFGWDAAMESSDEESDMSSSSAGISHLRRDRTFLHRSHGSFSHRHEDPDLADNSSEVSEIETDSDIDMLAHARRFDPLVVAEQERAFAMEVDDGREQMR
jgi:hypothetical protein